MPWHALITTPKVLTDKLGGYIIKIKMGEIRVKQKKKMIIIIASCVIVTCVVIVCVSVFAINRKREQSVQTQMEGFLTVTSDIYLEDEEKKESDDVGTQILKSIIKNVDYEIKKTSSDGCILKITSPDVYKMYYKIMKENPIEAFSSYGEYKNAVEDRFEQIFKGLESGNYEYRTTTVEVAIKDGTIETTNEFADAIYGGLITLQEEMIEKYIEEEEPNE